ncbi:BMP family protein [Paenibacillus sp. KN14-4R]|uniref:BMP family protein n=1 Tax=Paenibacillus sp. KN14-4R TaxID=3445773 RepID=UPI003F9EF0C3
MKKMLMLVCALVLFITAGCGAKNATTEGAAGNTDKPVSKDAKKIALVLPEKIGVNPFFQIMDEGAKKAGKEFNAQVKTIESTDPNAFEQNMRAAVADKYDLIITATFQAEDALKKVSAENPDQKFAIIDTVIEGPNVRSVVFREYESSYLLGAAAGLSTKTNTVGIVAAMDIPMIKKWTVPFEQGLKATNPNAKYLVNYVGGFTDPAKAKELAILQQSKGADFILGAAAVGDLGVFEAAKEKNFFTAGQDIDHTSKDPDHIVLSQLKGADTAAYETIKDFVNGAFKAGVVDYGLKEKGVGVPFVTHDSQTKMNPFLTAETITKLKQINDDIVSGKLVLKDPLKQ